MLWWIAQNVLVAGLLAAVAAVLCRVGRFSPAVKHALWLVVLVKLVTPPLACYRLPRPVERLVAAWSLETSAGDEWPKGEAAAAFDDGAEFAREADGVAGNGTDDRVFYAAEPADFSEAASPAGADPNRQRAATIDPPRLRFGLVFSDDSRAAMTSGTVTERAGMFALAVWLLGSVPLATLQVIRLVRLWRLTRRPAPTPVWLDRLVREAAERLRVRPPMVSVVPRACSPLVFALGRARLIWPEALSKQLTREQQEAVLLHELAHLRRRDHWVAWLELAAGWVWWFNPIYWFARQQLREYAELACDAWVVGLLPSGRRTYAQALIEVTEFISTAPAALPAVAMGNVARSSLERRLTMILRGRLSYRVPFAAAVVIGLSLLAVLPGWSHGQAPGQEGNATIAPDAGVPAAEGEPGAAIEPSAEVIAPPGAAEAGAGLGFHILAANDQPAETEPDVAAEPAGNDDDRIAALEAKLAALLAEVQELRGTRSSRSRARPSGGMGGGPMGPGGGMGPMGPGGMGMGRPMGPGGGTGMGGPMGPGAGMRMGSPTTGGTRRRPAANSKTKHSRVERIGPNIDSPRTRLPADVETLTRARYKLPAATAAALTSFIHDHVKAHVETVTDAGTLTITASQEDQLTIGDFIELLRERPEQPGPLPEAR